jgi:uncharacterized protein (TIGR03663 family)
MAEAILSDTSARASWLDRPLAPSWQRLAGLAAHWEIIAYIALIALGFTLRIWDVGGRAMHHDESLHAYYAWQLYAGKGYSYDPLMHGPFQFEVVPIFYALFGVSEFSARLLAVVLGTALIALPYFLRPYFGRGGALLTSVMLAVSPAFVYFSRFIRDDIYLAFFGLALFICIIRYLETRQARYVYAGAALIALAMASMEAAYLLFFTFGTFLFFEGLREFLANRDGPVLSALKSTSLDVWLTAFSILVVLTVLMYSTFFTNPTGVWDSGHALTSSARKDILGGLTYWQAQHGVMRGGQPWFYYLLVLPLYEQLAVVFGGAGLIYCFFRRSLVTTFLVWWALIGLGLYSWAGEKMPWLSVHVALPFILLAGLFMGRVLQSRRIWPLVIASVTFALLLALEVHSTFALNYQDGANPTEMLIYVQTSQDVPNVVSDISQLSKRLTHGKSLQIGLDDSDVGGWPFIWYLRDYPSVTETSTFNGPACNGTYCPVLVMLGPEFDANSSLLMKHYVAQRYRWNWWFPEDYKDWFPAHVGTIPLAISGQGKMDSAPIGTPSDWQHLWNWLIYRQPFGDRGARWLYFLVRRDLVPNSKYFSTRAPAAGQAPTQVATTSAPSLPAALRLNVGGTGVLSGPRDVAVAPNAMMYVADTLNHRIVQFAPGGARIRTWGQTGNGAGQFSSNDSPQGIAVGPNGEIYVADTWNQRIEVFSSDGRFLRQWGGGSIGNAPGQFYGPRSIAVSPSGRVYVADTGNKRIQVFSTSGKLLTTWGTAGSSAGQFQEPSSVAVGPSGQVYVADFWNQRIQEFTPGGTFVRSWAVGDWTPQSYDEPYLSVSSRNGDVYASDPQFHRVLVYTATGHLIGAFGADHLSLPVGLAALPSGRVGIADATANQVSVYAVSTTSSTKHAATAKTKPGQRRPAGH